ncbi:MAG: hypothetical protein AAGD10_07560 [Myxococcota bacterium]
MHRRVVLSLAFFGLHQACGGEAGNDPGDIDVAVAALGTGPERTADPSFQPRFDPIAPGEAILLGTGGQGAVYHAPVALRVTDRPLSDFPNPVRIRGEGRRNSDGLLVARVSTFSRLMQDEDGLISDTPVRVLLCPAPIGETLLDATIDLELRLEDDERNVYGRGSMNFSILCPDELCNELCAGL